MKLIMFSIVCVKMTEKDSELKSVSLARAPHLLWFYSCLRNQVKL